MFQREANVIVEKFQDGKYSPESSHLLESSYFICNLFFYLLKGSFFEIEEVNF